MIMISTLIVLNVRALALKKDFEEGDLQSTSTCHEYDLKKAPGCWQVVQAKAYVRLAPHPLKFSPGLACSSGSSIPLQVCISSRACVRTYMHNYLYVYTCISMYFLYIYICIYTYTQRHM